MISENLPEKRVVACNAPMLHPYSRSAMGCNQQLKCNYRYQTSPESHALKNLAGI